MALVLKTAPAVEPLSLEEVKAHLNIEADFTDDDSLLNGYIAAARQLGENLTRRQFVPATYELVIDEFPADGAIELPRPPLQAVDSITYLDTDGVEQTLGTDYYRVDTDSEPGRVLLAYDKSWPSTQSVPNAVRVRYQTGYPLDASSDPTTPQAIKQWMLIRIAGWYELREPFVAGTGLMALAEVKHRHHVDALLDAYTILTVPGEE